MVPQNQHVVIRVVLVSAETEEACQCVGIGGILQRQILNLFHFAFFINKALGTVGVDQLIAPVSGTAGLDNDADIVRPYVGCHLTDVGGGTTFPVRNYNVLRHHCGRGNRPVRIIEECRQFKAVFCKFTVELGQAVKPVLSATIRNLRLFIFDQHGGYIGKVVFTHIFQIRGDEINTDSPCFILADGGQSVDPGRAFCIER